MFRVMILLKKMIGVMFVLAASIFFVCAPANATSELADSNVQTKAPESYYVSKPLQGFDDYKFYSERKYNHYYRGWLNFQKESIGNLNYYHGYIFREPIQYPIPFGGPAESE